MSVTFSVPSASRKTKVVPCDYGKGEAWACVSGNRCGFCADGLDHVTTSEAPKLNVANVTARVLLGVLNIFEADLIGSLSLARIPAARRRIVVALSTSLSEQEATPATEGDGQGTNQCHWLDAGISADRIRSHLINLDALFGYAQAHGWEVSWG